jgi:hypothetical protein
MPAGELTVVVDETDEAMSGGMMGGARMTEEVGDFASETSGSYENEVTSHARASSRAETTRS